MTIEPRKDFRLSHHAKTWPDAVASQQFEAAAKVAMLELQFALATKAMDPTTAANNAFRLHGARMFLDILMSLADAAPLQPKKPTELDYSAS